MAQRHDGVRDFLITLLTQVCNNNEAEPRLIPLDNEHFDLRSTNTIPDARLDIKGGDFWTRRLTAFFDARVTDGNTCSNQNKSNLTITRNGKENEIPTES